MSAASTACDATDGYDPLNRPIKKVYSSAETPSVLYSYGQDLSGGGTNYYKGRLSSVAAGTTTVSYNQFDAMGRVTKHTQTTDNVPYVFTYGYNLAGLNTSTTYPSGRQVKTVYDAAGRANGVQSVMTGHVADVVKSVSYHPHGAALDLGLANGVTVSRTYNAWLQPVRIQAGSLMMLDYGYWVNGNNGNLQSHTVTRGVLIDSQTFQYDTKNRLSNASGTGWGENFLTDDYGNRAMAGAYPSWLATAFTPTSLSNFGGTNNRVYVNGAVYDYVGNQTTIGGYVSTYDGENRQRTSTLNSNTTTYTYDGDGRRVKKVTPSATTIYVYSVSGELAAEYGTNSNPVSGVRYLTPDMLGSVRLVSNAIGGVVSCHDYFPYGEEIVATAAGARTGCYAVGDGVTERFTGKKRDSETNLDYFGARYFSGAQGRFTSVDPKSAGADISNPQSWNGYAYALDNPFAYIDPNGKWPFYVHNQINGAAFGSVLSPHQSAHLGRVNWNADYGEGAQDPSRSYTHSMCTPGDPAGSCSFKISNYINVRLDQANQLSSGGRQISDDALNLFGQALHAMEDMGSPAHVTDGGNPIPWGNGLREGTAHVWAERDASVNWFRLGQSIRLGIAAFSHAFPYLAQKEGNPDAWARRAIEGYVRSYFAVPDKNADHTAEDSARLCALGNPAACGR